MASFASLVSIISFTFTPTSPSSGSPVTVLGPREGTYGEDEIYRSDAPSGGADLISKEHLVVRVAPRFGVSAEDAAGILGLAAGAIGTVLIKFGTVGDSTKTVCTITATNMQVHALTKIALPGKNAPRMVLAREFSATAETVLTPAAFGTS